MATVVARAKAPPERVARHWEDVSKLRWFGVSADHSVLHASWSFGRLRDAGSQERETVGVFQINRASFPGVDEMAVRAALEVLVPATIDGATRVYLMRVAAQIAASDALLKLAPAEQVSVFARPDATDTPASTPRWPEHARDRVAAALELLDAAFVARFRSVTASRHPALLDAVAEPE
jgi:hypothetical protein